MPFSDKQIDFFANSKARFNLAQGSVRSGKTFCTILAFIDWIKNGPPGDMMIIGHTRESLQRNVVNEMFSFLCAGIPGSKTSDARVFGRNLYFVGAHDESAAKRIQGSTLAGAYVDEIQNIPRNFVNMLLSRLSVSGAKLIATCNPEGPYHWLKKDFIDREGEINLKTWRFTLEDNPSLDEAYKKDLKKEYTGAWYQRMIMGEWAVAEGLVYDCLEEDNFTDEILNNASYYIAGIDYGTTNPTCCLIAAINPTQWPQITIIDEYYYDGRKTGRSKTDWELAEDIQQFLMAHQPRALYVDPAAASLRLELSKRDLPVYSAKNDKDKGIRYVHKFLSGKNLLIHTKCVNLKQELYNYSWDPKAAERGKDEPLKINDHACDALKYLVLSAFPEGSIEGTNEELSLHELNAQIYGNQSIYEKIQYYGSMGFNI